MLKRVNLEEISMPKIYERRPRKTYQFKLEQDRDAELINFLDQVKQTVNLATFCRAVFRNYIQQAGNQISLKLDIPLTTTGQITYKKYFFQADKERDQDIIDFLDQIRKKVDISSFFRQVMTDYMTHENGNLKLTINLKMPGMI